MVTDLNSILFFIRHLVLAQPVEPEHAGLRPRPVALVAVGLELEVVPEFSGAEDAVLVVIGGV